jgi:hypothetical protein
MQAAPCIFACLNTHAYSDVHRGKHVEVNRTNRIDDRLNVRSDRNDGKVGDFKEFTKSYNSIFFPLHNTRVPKLNVPDEKRRQLCGQMAGIVQEFLNLPTLSDTDRRILNISSAVALLLSGGR